MLYIPWYNVHKGNEITAAIISKTMKYYSTNTVYFARGIRQQVNTSEYECKYIKKNI